MQAAPSADSSPPPSPAPPPPSSPPTTDAQAAAFTSQLIKLQLEVKMLFLLPYLGFFPT